MSINMPCDLSNKILFKPINALNELVSSKPYNLAFAPIEDSDQPAHPRSLYKWFRFQTMALPSLILALYLYLPHALWVRVSWYITNDKIVLFILPSLILVLYLYLPHALWVRVSWYITNDKIVLFILPSLILALYLYLPHALGEGIFVCYK